MSFRTIFSLMSLAWLPLAAQEAPSDLQTGGRVDFKIAVVDIQSLFKNYRKTLLAEREIDLARAEIQKKSQLATNEIQARRQVIEQRIARARRGEVSEAQMAEYRREFPILRRELQIAQKEKESERDQANQKLNQQMMRRMAGILEEIAELTAKKAEAEGFDLVIDSSGSTSSQVAPMLFARDAVDLTDLMGKELSKTKSEGR